MRPPSHLSPWVVAIGASAGGTGAIETLLGQLQPPAPAILIVQHMPAGLTREFAARLDRACPLQVREAAADTVLHEDLVLVAPAGQHMRLAGGSGGYTVQLNAEPAAHYHRPSIDVLFHSCAAVAGHHTVGVLLTGMGRDGAEGLLAIRQAGGHTLVQDEASAIVYGMPRAALTLGAAQAVVAIGAMGAAIRAVTNGRTAPGTEA